MRWVAAALLTVVIVYVASAAFLFVWPSTGTPTRADALVILGPGLHGERFAEGEALMKKGLAEVLVVSTASGGTRPGGGMCTRRWRFEVICFRAHPFSTRGEAREVGRLASERGWRSLIVVTSPYHVERARMLLRRCYPARLEMVAAESRLRLLEHIERLAHESDGLLYGHTIARDC